MPNTRRRRFSVQNDISGRNSSKMQNGLQTSHHEEDTKSHVNNLVSMRTSRSKNKIFANSSKKTSSLEIVAECESATSVVDNVKSTVDKDVTASSSNIDLFNIISSDESTAEKPIDHECQNERVESQEKAPEPMEPVSQSESQKKARDPRPASRETPLRREKFPRQHRIKVRSPRRRLLALDQKGSENPPRSCGTAAIDWEQEVEVCVPPVTNFAEPVEERPRVSSHSMEDMCRICHGGESLTGELGQLISACACRGTVGRVHVKCLERWLTESGKSRCELCGTRYETRRVHRYGVARALLMWVLSQNAKQLMVDSLGIMLMSPLAVLAAWLSGRTLAGLMTQDSHATPWPLASTFVLACMTLVCYYCWIVSAATRHALGWWIWYRSQYEVRLQFQETEE